MLGADETRELVERWVEAGQVIRLRLGEQRFADVLACLEIAAETLRESERIAESYTDP